MTEEQIQALTSFVGHQVEIEEKSGCGAGWKWGVLDTLAYFYEETGDKSYDKAYDAVMSILERKEYLD